MKIGSTQLLLLDTITGKYETLITYDNLLLSDTYVDNSRLNKFYSIMWELDSDQIHWVETDLTTNSFIDKPLNFSVRCIVGRF